MHDREDISDRRIFVDSVPDVVAEDMQCLVPDAWVDLAAQQRMGSYEVERH